MITENMYSHPKSFFIILGLPVVCLIPDIALSILGKLYFPTPTDIAMDSQKRRRTIPQGEKKYILQQILPDNQAESSNGTAT